MQTLTPTARVILGMLKLGARTGYDIKKFSDVSTKFFWGASYGQIYPELKRLEEAGLVRTVGRSDRRGRTEYSLTATGERALRAWLTSREPMEFSFRDEALLKFFFGDAVPLEEALANVRQRIAEQELAIGLFRSFEAAGGFPALALEYGIAFLEWDVQWWRAMERRLKARRR